MPSSRRPAFSSLPSKKSKSTAHARNRDRGRRRIHHVEQLERREVLSGWVVYESLGGASRYSSSLSIPGGSITTHGSAYFGAPPAHSVNYSIVTLTAPSNNLSGSMIVNRPDLNYAFNNFDADLVFSVKDGTTPGADGLRFGYGPVSGAFGSEPGGTGLWFHVDTFDNVSGSGTDTGYEIWYGGSRLVRRQFTIYDNLHGSQSGISLDVTPSGLLTYSYTGDGSPSNFSGTVSIPGWNPQPNWKFGVAAQTGGLNDWHVVEDIYVYERTEPPTSSIGGSSGIVYDNENPSFNWNASDPNGDLASGSATITFPTGPSTVVNGLSGSISPDKNRGLGVYSISTSVTDASYRPGSSSRSYILDDDDKFAPTISLGGSIGNESHALPDQKLTWSATDASGIQTTSAIVLFNNSQIFSSSQASGQFNLESYASDPNYGPGVYELRVFATDNDNDRVNDHLTSNVFTRSVTITNVGPTANSGLNITAREGQTVIFDGSRSTDSDGETLDYEWDFGDGQTGVGVAPTHVYQDNGTYHVSLRVRDALGLEDTHSLDVTVVNVAVAIGAVTNSGPVNVGDSVTVSVSASDVAGDPLLYEFDFNNDGVYDTANSTGEATHSYSSANVYPVNVRVSDGDGGVATAWTAVVVGSPAAIVPEVTFDASETDVDEAAGTIAITASLDQPTTSTVFVPLLLGGTAASGEDFELPFTYLMIPAGAVTGAINIGILDDASDEHLEELVVSMGTPLNATLGAISSHSVRVDDNDEAPEVSFFEAARSINESAGTIPLRAKVAVVSGKEIRIPLALTGTADSPEDYLFANAAEIVIPAGASIGAVDLTIVDDALPESNQTIIISMGAPTNAFASTTEARPSTQTITIPQNDAPSLSLSPAFREVEENVGLLTITGTLSAPPALAVSATLAIDGTVQAADYADALLTLSFGMQQTASTTLRIVNDNLVEAAESLVVMLTSATNARLGATRSTVIEIAASDIPTVSFTASTQERSEDGADVVVTATLSNPSPETIYVPLFFSGTANEFDYSVREGQFLLFEPNQTTASRSIDLTDDAQTEPNEAIHVTLGETSNAVLGSVTRQTITVLDDDPVVSFEAATRVGEAAGSYRLTAVLSAPTNANVSVPYSIYGSALPGLDYTRPPGAIVIPAGQTTGYVDLAIVNDSLTEGTETLSIYMGVPSNANYGMRPAIDVAIIDDERNGFQLTRTEYEAPELPDQETYTVVTVEFALANPVEVVTVIPVIIDGFSSGEVEYSWNDEAYTTASSIGRLELSPNTKNGTAKVKIRHDGKVNPDQITVKFGTPSDEGVEVITPKFSISTTSGMEDYKPDPNVQAYEGDDDDTNPNPIPINYIIDGVERGANAVRSWIRATFSKGYIAGGVAFFDANKNGSLDFLDLNLDGIQDPNEPSEPSAVTGADGKYFLAISSIFDRDADLLFEKDEGQFVLTGGIDTATTMPQIGTLIAPMGFLVGSPLSTLAANLVNEHGLSTEQAMTRVTAALGLPAIDLRNFDTIAEAVAGNLDASLIFAAEAMLQDTAAQIASLVGNMADAPPPAVVANLVYTDLAAKIAPASAQLDLSNSFALEATIGGVLDRTGLELDQNVVSAAATVIGAANAHIGSLPLVSGLPFLTEVVQTQVVAQGAVATGLAGLSGGANADELSALLANFTGQALDDLIDEAPVGNITPVGISISDATLVEGDNGESLLEFTVSLDAVPSAPVNVSFATHNYSAQANSDYLAAAGSLSWEAGDASTRTVQVRVLGDALLESDETFHVQLFGANGAIVTAATGAGEIRNDDPFNYQAPNENIANALTVEIDGTTVALERNHDSIFEGPYSANSPITIAGADGTSNSLAVAFANVNPLGPNVALSAPITFIGGDELDSLSIANAAAQLVVHYLEGPTAGRFDIDGTTLTYTAVESVSNLIAPTLSLPSGALVEGPDEIVLTGAGANPQISYVYSWLVTKGLEIVASGNTPEVRFLAPDDGIYRVQLQTTAEGTGIGATIVDLQVLNVAPDFEAGAAEMLLPPVAGVFQRNDIAFHDPGADTWSGSVDYGDDTDDVPLEINQSTRTFALSHTFADSGVYTVTVTVQDDDGGIYSDTFDVTVILNTPPTAADDLIPVDENSSITFDVLADNGHGVDQDAEDNLVPTLTAALTNPSAGALTNHEDGTFTYDPRNDFDYLAVGESATVSFEYRIYDSFDESDTATVTLAVAGRNDVPTVAASASQVTVNEGVRATNAGTFADLDLSDEVTMTVSAGVITQSDGSTGTWTWTFDAVDGPNESGPITVTATDNHGAKSTVTFNLIVNNVAPTVHSATFALAENASNGTLVGAVAASDPGNDTVTFAITGGTGAAAFSIDPDNGQIRVANSALLDFESTPSLTLLVTGQDEDGATSTAALVTIDLLNQATISGAVFVDVNLNGLFDADEQAIDQALVELLDEDGDVLRSTTTEGGYYQFDDLPPGTYLVREHQPTGVADGADHLGSLGGTLVANDLMQITLARDDAADYDFSEQGIALSQGDAAGIGFWQNKHGQTLIAAGGAALADWLTTNFHNIFGETFANSDGEGVARFYKDQLFRQKSNLSGGPAKVDAQFMAVALAVYFTNHNLAGDVAAQYGFRVTDTGTGAKVVNVGDKGAAFDVANNTNRSVMQLLLATNALTDEPDQLSGFAYLYDRNGDGIISGTEAQLRSDANAIFSWINGQGGI